MCSWLTGYIAFVVDIIVNTFIMLDNIQLLGIKCGVERDMLIIVYS